MSIAFRIPTRMTVAEFLAWRGDGTATRYELVDGRLRAQDAASETHGSISANLTYLIVAHLRATRPTCRVVDQPGVRPREKADWNWRIPDLGVTCAPSRADAHDMRDPLLLVEILSPANAADTWDNIALYKTLPTLAEILVVDSARVAVQMLRRQADGTWSGDVEEAGRGGLMRLTSIGLELAVGEVYRGTHLA